MRSPRTARGFTLPELMVVVVIVGTFLLLVPPNLHVFGSRSRLENSANSLVAAVSLARTKAIEDGHPVTLELAIVKNEAGEIEQGHRFVFTNLPAQRSDLLNPEGEEDFEPVDEDEEELLTTGWHIMDEGVEYVGVSEEEGNWQQLRQDRPYAVTFRPDGSVEKGFAVRIENKDIETKREHRTITIIVNFLTAEAAAEDGLQELPPQREENEFVK
ncbi:MAG: GspH/FimT family pseudopilin [Planctomycetota bacterium]|jgi:prepilin-type N-terminal cleavage/methylation domain-containing protein